MCSISSYFENFNEILEKNKIPIPIATNRSDQSFNLLNQILDFFCFFFHFFFFNIWPTDR